MLACRHRRVHQECGWKAAEWQFKFSFLLAGMLPKIMDVTYHPDTEEVLYVHDAQQAVSGE